LKIIYEDDHLIVVDKPSGVLCAPSSSSSSTTNGNHVHSLVEAVHEHCMSSATDSQTLAMDQMVVHRLGMDTSGLLVMAKSIEAVRGLQALFRTRKITRQYEALVCGHLSQDEGLINLPLMRDYEHPPYMRVSTDAHQAALCDLDPSIVGKKLLEAPKASLTHYQVVEREQVQYEETDYPVTRLTLTSISGRTHQLNVHCAAIGHPIVQDTVYGYGGEAAPNGGLEGEALQENAPNRVDESTLQAIAKATEGRNMCVHAKYIEFRHPITKENMQFSSSPPF
jgi:tRNA pseudouridine32 synthase / 23S rRNA pseudouridine746 synthase